MTNPARLTSAADNNLPALMAQLGQAARKAAGVLALTPGAVKEAALTAAAAALRADIPAILAANAGDLEAAAGLTAALRDRLRLDAARLEVMARALETIAALPDPVGTELAAWQRPNGLNIARVRVPLGVVGVIYESRPNVTADAGALCLKAGNAVILRGGAECFHSSQAVVNCLRQGLRAAGLPEAAIQLVPTTDRAAVSHMLGMTGVIDVLIPRGGKPLTQLVMNESRVPVLLHLDGLCHTYVDGAADPAMARAIVLNAKMRRVSICGATETLLVDRAAAYQLPAILGDLITAGCQIRGDGDVQAMDPRVQPASPEDWDTEYLDAILSVRLVDGVDAAIAHINRHGSHHTDSIITGNAATAEYFLARVDSAIVTWNASTQFADGAEFGMGAEIGIATGKLHARGPVGAEQLTTFKYLVRGSGQVRP